MKRKQFLKKGILGLTSMIAIPITAISCKNNDAPSPSNGGCSVTPTEAKGPFPIKTPSQLVIENITSDRTGVALLMNLTIQNRNNNCAALAGVLVDVWHCDREGNYSEYGTHATVNFLRGRQTSNADGNVSFITIYPGWYPGRAPHIHIEVLRSTGASLLVTQIAFPEDISSQVYTSALYAPRTIAPGGMPIRPMSLTVFLPIVLLLNWRV
jgi:protocatechuate 3,4-dioxygenase beta subunit